MQRVHHNPIPPRVQPLQPLRYPAPKKGKTEGRRANTAFDQAGDMQGVLLQMLLNFETGFTHSVLSGKGKPMPLQKHIKCVVTSVPLHTLVDEGLDFMHQYIIPSLLPKVSVSRPILSSWIHALNADIVSHEAHKIHQSIPVALFLKRVKSATSIADATKLQRLTVYDIHKHDLSMLPKNTQVGSRDSALQDDLLDDCVATTQNFSLKSLGLQNLEEKMLLTQDVRLEGSVARDIFPHPILASSVMYALNTYGVVWFGAKWEPLARAAFHELTSAVYCDPPGIVTAPEARVNQLDPTAVFFRPILLCAFDVAVNTLLAAKHKAHSVHKRIVHRESLFLEAHRKFRRHTFCVMFMSWRRYTSACRKIRNRVRAACTRCSRDSVIVSAIQNWRCVARFRLEDRKRRQLQTEKAAERSNLIQTLHIMKNYLSTHEVLLLQAVRKQRELTGYLLKIRKMHRNALRRTKHGAVHFQLLVDNLCPSMSPEVSPVADWPSLYKDDSAIGGARLFSLLIRNPDVAGHVNRVLQEMKHLIPLLRVLVGILVPEAVAAKQLLHKNGMWEYIGLDANDDPVTAKKQHFDSGRTSEHNAMTTALELFDTEVASAVTAIKHRFARFY